MLHKHFLVILIKKHTRLFFYAKPPFMKKVYTVLIIIIIIIPTSPKCFSVGSCKNYVQYSNNTIQYNAIRYDTIPYYARYDTMIIWCSISESHWVLTFCLFFFVQMAVALGFSIVATVISWGIFGTGVNNLRIVSKCDSDTTRPSGK